MNKKIFVILPAYCAERTLMSVYENIPHKAIDGVILTDDGSKDGTAKLSRKLGIKTFVHKENKGYGANQKTCYREALKMGVDFIIMLHPDGQYDPLDIKKFINAYKNNEGDLIIGSRFRGEKNETPFYKAISIRIIALIFNLVLGLKLTEVNSGYRGYKREVLEKIPFEKNGNGYLFDPQAIIQTKYYGFKIAEVPVSKVYNEEAISPNFKKSIEHGIENIGLLVSYLCHISKIKKADFLPAT